MIDIEKADVLVIGAGFFGLTIAERVANELKKSVLVVEKRDHIGGNAFSFVESSSGIEVHKYGSHLFHTNNFKVWNYINKFGSFNSYQHKVVALANGKYFNLPINLQTLSNVFDRAFTPEQANGFLKGIKTETKEDNLETRAMNLIGKELYELFIKGYTEKQWGVNPSLLPSSIINRLPVRNNFDSRYFTDSYQGLPMDGYYNLFNRMIDHELISVMLNIDFFTINHLIKNYQLVIYTGPIDSYYNYKHGLLGWRTVDFEFETLPINDFQGNAVINYCDLEIPYTRIHEFFHLHPERTKNPGKTVIAKEFSRIAEEYDEPFYPINSKLDREKLLKYRSEKTPTNILFGGRLGTYQYLDMHMAIASALNLYETKIVEWFGD